MMESRKIKISIIEDSQIHTEWFRCKIQADSNIRIISEDRLGSSGIASVKTHHPDIVLLDFQLEDITGLEVAKRIKAVDKKTRIFAVTAHTEASIINKIINDKNIDALAVKGSRYFDDNIIKSIHDVANGGTYIDPSLLRKLREKERDSLSNREFEILVHSATGKSDIEIANNLFVDPSHVRNIKSKIKKKIKTNNFFEMISSLLKNKANK